MHRSAVLGHCGAHNGTISDSRTCLPLLPSTRIILNSNLYECGTYTTNRECNNQPCRMTRSRSGACFGRQGPHNNQVRGHVCMGCHILGAHCSTRTTFMSNEPCTTTRSCIRQPIRTRGNHSSADFEYHLAPWTMKQTQFALMEGTSAAVANS